MSTGTGALEKRNWALAELPFALCEADLRFLKFCRELRWGKLSGVLIKDGVPIMADLERRDVRFDISEEI